MVDTHRPSTPPEKGHTEAQVLRCPPRMPAMPPTPTRWLLLQAAFLAAACTPVVAQIAAAQPEPARGGWHRQRRAKWRSLPRRTGGNK